MNIFYLIRHAHAVWTPDENRPLSARGQADAARIADVLRAYPIDAIYASPYARAWQTVAPLAKRLGLPIHTHPDLRERTLSGVPVDDFQAAITATWRNFDFAHPGGESNAAAQRRGVQVVVDLQAQWPNTHIVLATHGNLLALILQHFDATVDYAFWQTLTMPDVYQLAVTETTATYVHIAYN